MYFKLTTTEVLLVIVCGERARVVVLERRRDVSGVAGIVTPRGLCRAREQSLADVAVVAIVVDVARLLIDEAQHTQNDVWRRGGGSFFRALCGGQEREEGDLG